MRALPLSIVLFVLCSASVAQAVVDSLLRVLPQQSGRERIITLGNVAWEIGLNDPSAALPFGREALQLAVAMGDSVAIATAANDLAIVEHRLGHLQLSIELNTRALRIRKTVSDSSGMAASHSKIAVAYTNLMVFDSALAHNYAAARILERIGDDQRFAQVSGNIGFLYQQMGDLVKAERVLRETTEQLRRKGGGYVLAMSLGQFGQLLEQVGKIEEAYTVDMEAMAMFAELGMKLEVANIHNQLGMIARKRRDDLGGLMHYRTALDMARELKDLEGQATYGMNVANVLYDLGRASEALPYYAQSLRLCREQGFADQHMSLLGGYIKALKASNDLSGALRLQDELVLMKDSVYKAERLAAISDMQVKYETERTENELLESQARSERQQRQLDRQRARIIGLVVGFVILGCIAVLLVRVQRLRHRAQLSAQVIAEREQGLKAIVQSTDAERKRIAAELHDGVGQLLTGLKYQVEVAVGRDPGLDRALQLADEAGREVRDIAHRMMPRALRDVGLVPALADMLDRTLALPGMRHTFEHHGMQERLAPEVETGVYRIAQELVNNILKHAQATHVDVQLLRNKGALIMLVADDGVGIDPALASRGLGMRNLRDRARILNGTIVSAANSPRGTLVTLRIIDPTRPAE